MSQRNCPNCGAPYKTELNTCPYCGTSYFDMSAIDINEDRPFYLKIKMNGMVLTSKVVAEPNMEMNFTDNEIACTGKCGEVLQKFKINRSLGIDMHFKSVYEPHDVLFTMEIEE